VSKSSAQPEAVHAPSTARIAEALQESARVLAAAAEALAEPLAAAVEACIASLRGGGRILLFGNGGSAAQAQHIADELVNRFRLDRPALSALALTVNASDLTAIANDVGFEFVFARQVEAHGRPGDVAIGLSTSGGSKNVILALERAAALGLETVAFCGERGGLVAEAARHVLRAPSLDTARIQEVHTALGHVLCERVEAAFAGESGGDATR